MKAAGTKKPKGNSSAGGKPPTTRISTGRQVIKSALKSGTKGGRPSKDSRELAAQLIDKFAECDRSNPAFFGSERKTTQKNMSRNYEAVAKMENEEK